MVDVPPPPENPFMMPENGNGNENGNGEDEGLDQGAPSVAAKPGRVIVVLVVVGALLAFLLSQIFSGEKKEEVKVEKDVKKLVTPMEPPPLPETPDLPPPVITPLPNIPEPQLPTTSEVINPQEDAAAKQQAMARMQSPTIISGGGIADAVSKSSSTGGANDKVSTDPNTKYAKDMAITSVDRVDATTIGNMRNVIAQGRLIHATLESAINTDLPAPIRAIVSRDTYGEAGREPLIPKGSRLIGVYNTDLTGGQSRVFVLWQRVIRPDGVDVMINSPLVDQIGQAGIGGQVDTKFQSIFSRAILSSIVTIGTAIASDEISGGSTTTISNGTGSTTQGDAATTATVDALNRLGGVSDGFLQNFMNMRATILVDQGTVINVFVNRDLVFPEDLAHSTRIIN